MSTRKMLATNLGGNVRFESFQFTALTDLAAITGAGTQTVNLFVTASGPPYNTPGIAYTFGLASIVVYVRIKHSVAFSGGGLTALTVSMGKSGGANNFFAGAFNIFQAVADTTLQETTGITMGQLSSVTPNVTFVPTGANLSAVTAGVVNLDVLWMRVDTVQQTSNNTTVGEAVL